ncbi:MAG: hypothetical protein II916_05650, partial [Oscillospiraceae bacterium]|nr:hypothetical protein [Oscillospiraceae bacterium]
MKQTRTRLIACLMAACMTGLNVPAAAISTQITAFAAAQTISENLKLEQDMTVSGDLVMDADVSLDLNGHTLTVEGDFNQKAGAVYIGKGTLHIKGDYINAKYLDGAGTGSLQMNYTDGKVIVDGSYFQWSSAISTLTYGEMYIGGDFEGSKASGEGGFDAWNDHTVIFTGDAVHKIYF